MQLNMSQTIFVVFFAIFWGTAANAWPKWKPFHWTLVIGHRKVAFRVAWSFVALNVAPVAAFCYVLTRLEGSPEGGNWWVILLGVIPAFAIFGMYRIWIGVVELFPDAFYYSKAELASDKQQLMEIDPSQEELKIERRRSRWWANILFGVLYVLAGLSVIQFSDVGPVARTDVQARDDAPQNEDSSTTALLGWGAALATIAAAIIYWRQLQGMHLTSLVQYLESRTVREARWLLMEKKDFIEAHPYDGEKSWDTDLRKAAAEVCASYNIAGHLTRRLMVPRSIVMAHWGISARRLWQMLATFIEKRSEAEGDDYLSGFRWLASHAPVSKELHSDK